MARFRIPYHAQKRRLLPQAAFFFFIFFTFSFRPVLLPLPRALPGRRDGDIAPYRHYAREVRTAPVPLPRPVPHRPRPIARSICHTIPSPYPRPPPPLATSLATSLAAPWQVAHAESFAGGVSVRPP